MDTLTLIGATLLNILKFHITFSLFFYLVVIGIQWLTFSNLITNLNIVRHLDKQYLHLLTTKVPPIDGWIVTLLTCLVPLMNIIYGIFYIKMGVAEADSDFILAMKENYEESLQNQKGGRHDKSWRI